MPPTSYVQLGPYNDVRPINVVDIRQVVREGANPFAAPGGGSQGYNDLEGWAEFTMRDWQAGAGQHDPEAGGFLYGIVDSRVPGQLILPQKLYPLVAFTSAMANQTTLYQYSSPITPFISDYYYEVGPTGADGTKIAFMMTPGTIPAGLTAINRMGATVFFLCTGPSGTQARVSLYSGALPTTEQAYRTDVTLYGEDPLPRWVRAEMNFAVGTVNGDWVVIEPTANIRIIKMSVPSSGVSVNTAKFVAGAWVDTGGPMAVIVADTMMQDTGYSSLQVRVGPFIQRGNSMYAVMGDKILKWAPWPTASWSVIDDVGTTLTHGLAVFNNEIYFGRVAGNAYKLTAADAHTNLAYASQFFYSDANYLWKVNGTTISYSADATTWTDVLNATTATYPVKAIASMGGVLYYATAEGVFYIAPGDFCKKLFFFTRNEPNLPVRMLEFQGNIFVIGGNAIFRVDPGGGILPIPLPGDDEDLREETEYLRAIASAQNWLYVATSNSAGDRGTVWSWQPEGWHPVAFVPANTSYLGADRFEECVWIGDASRTWRFRASDAVRNPYFDVNSEYSQYAWIETDKFFGTNMILRKDLESVYIDGELLNTHVWPYYMTDTTAGVWKTLGYMPLASDNGGEIRFSDYAATPREARWVKLGLLITSENWTYTPRIRAISLKYTPMVGDRFRWRLDIKISRRMTDNDDGLYTYESGGDYSWTSAIAHIDACVNSVVPLIYQDVDGIRYEVKVVANSRSVERTEPIRGGTALFSYVYSLTLEQVNVEPTTY